MCVPLRWSLRYESHCCSRLGVAAMQQPGGVRPLRPPRKLTFCNVARGFDAGANERQSQRQALGEFWEMIFSRRPREPKPHQPIPSV